MKIVIMIISEDTTKTVIYASISDGMKIAPIWPDPINVKIALISPIQQDVKCPTNFQIAMLA